MANELEHIDVSGLTLYAKPTPIVTSTWGSDDVALTEVPSTGYYAASVVHPENNYVVFLQSGGSPASTDGMLGTIALETINNTSGASSDLFVDSGSGNDTNAGTSWSDAKLTIASANTASAAGDTIHLSGGTHTIATGTTILLATGVNVIGTGLGTLVTGDPEPSVKGLFTFSGNNRIANMSLNSQERCFVITATAAANLCSVNDCYLTATVGISYLTGPSSSQHTLEINNCIFDLVGNISALDVGNANSIIMIHNCQFRGLGHIIYAAQTTNDLVILIDGCAHTALAMTTSHDSISLTSSGTGDIQCGIRNTQFALGVGVSVEINASSTGDVVVQDLGGNNIDETSITVLGDAEIKYVGRNIMYSGTTTALGSTSTLKDSALPSGAPDFYNGSLVRFDGGPVRLITDYDFITKTITFDPVVLNSILSGTTYDILEGVGINHEGVKFNSVQDRATWATNLRSSANIMKTGTATGGSPTTLIDSSLTAADDTYNNRIVYFLNGTLAGQVAAISDYDLGTRTITISQVTTSPSNEAYIII